MTKVPSLNYEQVIDALRRDEVLKITIPAHRPLKRSTLAHILKQARLSIAAFEKLL